jgi:hypothetical protein
VLERVCERLAHSVVNTIDPDRAEQRPSKPWLGSKHELPELLVGRHVPAILTPNKTIDENKRATSRSRQSLVATSDGSDHPYNSGWQTHVAGQIPTQSSRDR